MKVPWPVFFYQGFLDCFYIEDVVLMISNFFNECTLQNCNGRESVGMNSGLEQFSTVNL